MKVKLQEGDHVAFCYEEGADMVGAIASGFELYQLGDGKLKLDVQLRGFDSLEVELKKGEFIRHIISKEIDYVYTIANFEGNLFGIKSYKPEYSKDKNIDDHYTERKMLDEETIRELQQENVETRILKLIQKKR